MLPYPARLVRTPSLRYVFASTPPPQRGDALRGSSTESARAALLQRGDASRGSSTESVGAAWLQRGDASRGSSTRSAKTTWLQRGDALEGFSTASTRATLRAALAGIEPSCWHLRAAVQLWKSNACWERGVWTTQVPHFPLFTQLVLTLGAETLVGMCNSGLALVHLQLFP